MLNAKIKKMLLSENGASIPAIQRKLNIGFVEAKARIQKLSKRYNIDYKNDYNNAVIRYYQAYLRSTNSNQS